MLIRRARYDAIAAENARLREELAAERGLTAKLWDLIGIESRRCDELLERFVSMKQAGFVGGHRVAPHTAPEPFPDVVQQALDAVQEDGLEETARAWLLSGLGPEEVAQRIIQGGEVPL